MVDKNIKFEEAIKRMKLLNIFDGTILSFAQEGKVSMSEPPLGAHFWLDEKQQKIVDEFEKKYNALVYTGIRTFSSIGTMDSFLFVSDHKREWKMEREDLKMGETLAYVYNYDFVDGSEIGYIAFEKTVAGGLKRVG